MGEPLYQEHKLFISNDALASGDFSEANEIMKLLLSDLAGVGRKPDAPQPKRRFDL